MSGQTPVQTNKKYFITGAGGFIGSWIVKCLLDYSITSPSNIIATDLREDHSILSQLITEKQLSEITYLSLDVTSFDNVFDAINKHKPQYIIHLAGLQIPACRANPLLGGKVNVIGCLNIFESVKRYNENNVKQNNFSVIAGVVYASSAAVCGLASDYNNGIANDNDFHKPTTHYGFYKLCNEGSAKIYWNDNNIPSIGLRPSTVFGVGRELGLTSDVTKAIKASLLNIKFTINYCGDTLFNYVEDIALLFIRCCTKLEENPGAYKCNISGTTMTVKEFVNYIYQQIPNSKNLISINPQSILLPIPSGMTQQTLDKLFGKHGIQNTSVLDGIRKTIKIFTNLQRINKLHRRDIPNPNKISKL